jgi:hypothetical protein
MKAFIGQRLQAVLLNEKPEKGFEKLSKEDRQAVAEILAETKADFWKQYVVKN